MRKSASRINVPSSKLRAATSTCAVGCLAFAVTREASSRYSKRLAPAETTNAKISTENKRWFIFHLSMSDSKHRSGPAAPPGCGNFRSWISLPRPTGRRTGTTCGYGYVTLTRRCVCTGKAAVRRTPDSRKTSPRTYKQCRSCQANKRQQQGVFDQVLALLIFYELSQHGFFLLHSFKLLASLS